MTTVTFENATIRDVIGKAARIAPTKGSAFDKAAGILIEVDAGRGEVVVRSTNLEVFYMEIVDTVSIEGDSVRWLIPSQLLDGICAKLPITSGATIAFNQDGAQLKLATGRMRANIRLMDPTYYESWPPFDPSALSPVSDFGARLEQVQWAASKNNLPPVTGVHLDGEVAAATDSFRVAVTPCGIPQLHEPVTIPASIFAPLMKSLGEVSVGQEDGQLLIMPDETTQIRAVIFAQEYPKVRKVFKRDETNAIMVKKQYLLDMIEQAMVMGQRDRTPILKAIIGLEEFAVLMEDQELGLLGNVMDIAGQATHDRQYIGFTPDNLTAALRNAPNEEVTLFYHFGKPMKPVRLDGGSGYEVLIMPRNLERSADD